MYNEVALRRFAEWEPLEGWSEEQANGAAQSLVGQISSSPDIKGFVHKASYENFAAAYVYLPSEVQRQTSGDGETRTNYPSILLYFSHLAPVFALGSSTWGETIGKDGRVWARGYGGLNLPELTNPEEIPGNALGPRLVAALARTGCTALSAAYLRESAPAWFEPRQRSEGAHPWDRMFHLFF